MPAVLGVDPDVFTSVGRAFLAANDAVCDIVAAAATSANEGHGMAGVDSSSVDWATAYDGAADALLRASATVVDALGVVGDRLSLTGDNHAGAEAASTARPGAGPPAYSGQPGTTRAVSVVVSGCPEYAGGPAPGRAVSVVVSTPPSADGSPAAPPAGWDLIAHLIAWIWPSGHPDQLWQVGQGWLTVSLKLSDQADALTGSIAELSGQVSPEVPYALRMCTGLQTALRTLADQSATVSQVCVGYGNAISTMHHDIVEELLNLLDQEAAIEAAGALLAGPTGGVAEIPTQAVAASRAEIAAFRVVEILTRLSGDVLSLRNLVQAVTEQVLTVLLEMRRITDAEQALRAATALVEAGIPPVDLQANEDDNPDAHVIAEHVDKSREYLASRGKAIASTFTSLAAATTAVSTVLALRSTDVADWLAGPKGKQTFTGPLPPGAGVCLVRSSGQLIEATQVAIVLKKRGNDYFILTAYPEP